MIPIITTFTCSVYTQRPAACRNYPFRDAQITFDSCRFLRQDVDLAVLSAKQKMDYCLQLRKVLLRLGHGWPCQKTSGAM